MKKIFTILSLLVASFAMNAQTTFTNGSYASPTYTVNIVIVGATPGHSFILTNDGGVAVSYSPGIVTANASGIATATATITEAGSQPPVTSVAFTPVNISGGSDASSSSYAFGVPLPVEFIRVTASSLDGKTTIEWATASEIDNDRFVIERSQNGQDWSDIGTIKGAGNSQQVLEYTFVDESSLSAANVFYRVRQMDFNFNFSYSEVVKVSGSTDKIKTYPNPILANEVYVSLESADILDVNFTTLSGTEVSFDFDSTNGRLSFDNLAAGIYLLSVNGQVSKIAKY